MRHGSNLDPPNRFERVRQELDLEHWEWDQEHPRSDSSINRVSRGSQREHRRRKQFSPDIPFRYSLNPYRGCVHACAYC
ncbi:MAG: hypothetical protein R3B96_12205 [Pirellulaceae bacterium]